IERRQLLDQPLQQFFLLSDAPRRLRVRRTQPGSERERQPRLGGNTEAGTAALDEWHGGEHQTALLQQGDVPTVGSSCGIQPPGLREKRNRRLLLAQAPISFFFVLHGCLPASWCNGRRSRISRTLLSPARLRR